MTLLDGKQVADKIVESLKLKTFERKNKGQKVPHLAAILVGNDGASQTYVANKVKTCEAIGFTSTLITLTAETQEFELLQKIDEINKNVQLSHLFVHFYLFRLFFAVIQTPEFRQ